MKKQKSQLYVCSEEYIEKLREQFHKCIRTRDMNESHVLAGMIMLLKEHRVPPEANTFAKAGWVRVAGSDEHPVVKTGVEKTWEFPKDLMIDDHKTL